MSTQQLAEAPDFTLEHALGYPVSLREFRGKRVVVVIGNRDTTDQLRQGILTIRRSLNEDQVAVLAVINLKGAPRPARKLIKGYLKKTYDKISAEFEAQNLSGGVNMLIDWSGDVASSYSLSIDKQAAAIVIDEQGRIIGYGTGDQLGPQVLTLLQSG